MKYILFSALAVTLLAAGCNKAGAPTINENSEAVANQSNAGNQNNSPTPPPSELQTYSNSSYNFKFQYPTEFTFADPSYANLEQKIVQLGFGRQQYAGTNFGDAAVSVSAGSTKSLQECLAMSLPENANGFKDTRSLNGTTFYVGEGGGAATGNLYTSKIFRTLRGSSCYEIIETIHTSNIGNYEPGTVKEVDTKAVWAQLDDVVNTFEFTK